MIRSATATDTGRHHDLNEDSLGQDLERSVWLVADGMGGHAAGEVASRVARDTILRSIASGQSLHDATLAAHAAIVGEAETDQARKGMGTTSVLMQIRQGICELVWVGDSRGYLYRKGSLRQLTKDHSFMQMLIDRNHLTEEQARTHPKRNVVTQVLGYSEPVPDAVSCPLETGDTIMLCSDGLYDELTDAEMATLLAQGGELQDCVDRLVDAACDKGGRDNISAILVVYEGPDAQAAPPVNPDFERTTVARGRSPAVSSISEVAARRQAETRDRKAGHRALWTAGITAVIVIAAIVLWISGIFGGTT